MPSSGLQVSVANIDTHPSPRCRRTSADYSHSRTCADGCPAATGTVAHRAMSPGAAVWAASTARTAASYSSACLYLSSKLVLQWLISCYRNRENNGFRISIKPGHLLRFIVLPRRPDRYRSPYRPHFCSGYAIAEGAHGEYNGEFIHVNQYVLRGSSCATPAGHSRPTYRNFFLATTRGQFSGIRLTRS